MKLEYRPAAPDESDGLSELAIRSKSHWGYPPEQLELWRKDLRIDREAIETHTVRVAWVGDMRVGVFVIRRGKEDELEHFWLHPSVIGQGVGRQAFAEAVRVCRRLGIEEFIIVSDPHAEGFYLHQGAVRIGKVESLPQGRMLPKLLYRME